VEVFLAKFFEIIFQDDQSQIAFFDIGTFLNLKDQAFFQISGTYAGRFEFLNFPKNSFQFFFVSIDVLTESEVVANRTKGSSDIAIVFNGTYELGSYQGFSFAKLKEA